MTHTIHSENLHWVKSERRFHADASTLCLLPGLPMPRRIEVVSQRTGKSAFFNLTELISPSRFFNGRRFRRGAGWFYKPDPICTHSAATLGVFIWNT